MYEIICLLSKLAIEKVMTKDVISVRAGFVMPVRPVGIAKLAGSIAERGGSIVSFVTREGGSLHERGGTLKITGLDRSAVEGIFRQADAEIPDIR